MPPPAPPTTPPSPPPCVCNASGRPGSARVTFQRYRAKLQQDAIRCVDPYAGQRTDSRLTLTRLFHSTEWLLEHAAAQLDPQRPQILMDYAYNGMAYPLPGMTHEQWVF
eukprot:EG_transcript_54911